MNTENTKITLINEHGAIAALCALLRESSELEVRSDGRRIAAHYGMATDDYFDDLGKLVIDAIVDNPLLIESANVGIRLHRWKYILEIKSGEVIARSIVG